MLIINVTTRVVM